MLQTRIGTDELLKPIKKAIVVATRRLRRMVGRKKASYLANLSARVGDNFNISSRKTWAALNRLTRSVPKHGLGNVNRPLPHMNIMETHFRKLLGTGPDDPEELTIPERPFNGSPLLFQPIQEAELLMAIAKLALNKAQGPDNISNDMLKHSPTYIQQHLLRLFNMCYEFGIYPQTWRKTYIAPIHKKGNIHNPANYRGLALSSCVAKLYTSILNAKLYDEMQRLNLHVSCQGGFVKGRRTSDNLYVLNAIRDGARRKKKNLWCLFLDITKAYDTVDRDRMFQILQDCLICPYLTRAIMTSLDGTLYAIKLDGYVSDFFRTIRGLKQGDSLSPLLYNLYTHHLRDIIMRDMHLEDHIPSLASNRVPVLAFADDTILLSYTIAGLQQILNSAILYLQGASLTINPTKCYLVTTSRQKDHFVTIGDIRIVSQQCAVYLGLDVQPHRHSFIGNDTLMGKARRAAGRLAAVTRTMPVEQAVQFYNTLVAPVAAYGAEIWYPLLHKNSSAKRDAAPPLPTPLPLNDTSPALKTDPLVLNKQLPEETNILRFLKRILRVPQSTPTATIRGDTNIRPAHHTLIKRALLYALYVDSDKVGELTRAAASEQQNLDESNIPCLAGGVRHIAHTLELSLDRNSEDKREVITEIDAILEVKHQQYWLSSLWANTSYTAKLAHYRQYKLKPSMENYLNKYKHTQRRLLLMLRSGIAPIYVELGRWNGIPYNQRTCPYCPQQVETETHLFKCPRYVHLCDCDSVAVHKDHQDKDILRLLADMNQTTCQYIYRVLLLRLASDSN